MPAGSGRKVCPKWLEVTKLPDESKVQCNHCGTKISSKIERIRSHLNKCNKQSISSTFVSTELGEDAPSNSARNDEREIDTEPCAKRQRTMKNFTVSFPCTVRYDDMMMTLRPGYSGPSSKELGGKLLDVESDDVDNSIRKHLSENTSVTLLLNGWSNVKKDPVIATCIQHWK
ncbi:hypothetical protein JTE90_014341 [Oedothorax gibbosus]|uniref:BED-type domain-containing protein n=1 Tax=Oedothorax gibbosus TaxID=931172 RepID=A0AAV6TU89_9ARAC|nr:hypothetical protein JTE90_014341 [Oedothorax gibbosus]